MISVTGITKHYILQPKLLDKHHETLQWLSSCLLWKSELNSFQHFLDDYAPFLSTPEEKKQMGHLQNLILYYQGEVVDGLRKKLRNHEAQLATMLESKDESSVGYYKNHPGLMDEMKTFDITFRNFREQLLTLMESAKTKKSPPK